MACVIQIPVAGDQPILRSHARMCGGAGIWRQDVERRRRNTALHCPVDGTREDIAIVSVKTEDEAAVDHDPEVVESASDSLIVAAEILALVGVLQTARREALEADEEAAQSGGSGFFDHVVPQDRVDGGGCLKDPSHSAHAAKQLPGETHVAEQMVV